MLVLAADVNESTDYFISWQFLDFLKHFARKDMFSIYSC